jgi:hypothetical protein
MQGTQAGVVLSTLPHITELRDCYRALHLKSKSFATTGFLATLMWGPVRHFAESCRTAAWLTGGHQVYRVDSKQVPITWTSSYVSKNEGATEKLQPFMWPIQPECWSLQQAEVSADETELNDRASSSASLVAEPDGSAMLRAGAVADTAGCSAPHATPKYRAKPSDASSSSEAPWHKQKVSQNAFEGE